jgi:hypothetical protein
MGEGRRRRRRAERVSSGWKWVLETKAKIELCVIRQIFEVKGRFGKGREATRGRRWGEPNLNAIRLNEP